MRRFTKPQGVRQASEQLVTVLSKTVHVLSQRHHFVPPPRLPPYWRHKHIQYSHKNAICIKMTQCQLPPDI